MNEMLKRAISGAVFVAVLITCILYSSYSFLILFFIFMLISIFEFSRMLQIKSITPYVIATLLFGLNCNALSTASTTLLIGAVTLIVLFLFIKEVFTEKTDSVKKLGNIFLILVYSAIPYLFIAKIPFVNSEITYNSSIILGLFILIWSSDTFAYLTGISIGKHKLIERISPKKTIEGFLGGVIATLIIAYVLSLYFDVITTIHWIAIGGIVSVFGVLGDLIASLFKRQTGVKDTGNIIPGHGGIIDRLDSIIFAAPFVYLYLKIILENVS